ncbi:hypothetical protein EV182_005862 [Spiromyces aspiralis]|uniref:Uncharacterized protein n=1 Tax=Spiromyces aspiralis TaxID=68401 RepID=A0ACC1HBN8_9FUNG|nr:hypothetical protein EV182_005862 [Spiromyces aspiralis]
MVLSRQLWYQIALSSYFILIDFFVLCQWVYYDYLGLSSLRSRSLKGHSALADPYAPSQSPPPPLLSTETPYATPTEATHLLVAAQPATLSASSLSTPNGAINSSNYRPSSPPTDLTLMRRRCLNVCACIALVFIVVTPCVLVYKHNPDISRFLDSNSERIGQVFGWTCNCFYWSSRLPQAYKNYRRKSVVGLSVFTFITIFTGNITSSISIALQYPTAPDDYIRKSRPFIIGPIGSIAIDVFFITQVLYYTHLDRKRQTLQQQQLERQEQEQQSLSKHSANHQLTISVHSVGLE